MKKRVPLAVAAALTACGAVATTSNDAAESAPQGKSKAAQKQPQIGFPDSSRGGMAGCFDPSLSGYARTQAERIGGVPCEQEAGETETGGASWVGEYRGPVDGATGVVTITRAGGGLSAEAVMFSDHGCGGSVSGPVTMQAGRLVLTKTPSEAEAPQCRIVMTREGSSLTVQENRCTYYHGRSCEFNGRLTRVGASAAPAKSAPAHTTNWIVGTWVNQGEVCGAQGIRFGPDGEFETTGESGRWMLSGNALTITTLVNFDLSEEDGTPVSNPRPVRSTIVKRGPRGFTMRDAGGKLFNIVRCH